MEKQAPAVISNPEGITKAAILSWNKSGYARS